MKHTSLTSIVNECECTNIVSELLVFMIFVCKKWTISWKTDERKSVPSSFLLNSRVDHIATDLPKLCKISVLRTEVFFYCVKFWRTEYRQDIAGKRIADNFKIFIQLSVLYAMEGYIFLYTDISTTVVDKKYEYDLLFFQKCCTENCV